MRIQYEVGDKTENGWEIVKIEHIAQYTMRKRMMIVEDNENHIIKLTIGEMGYHYLDGGSDYFVLDSGETVTLSKNEFGYTD